MDFVNPNAPLLFPRVKADALAELPLSFAVQLEAESAIADRADLEPRMALETFGTRAEPVYQRTDADARAERLEDSYWQVFSIIWNSTQH